MAHPLRNGGVLAPEVLLAKIEDLRTDVTACGAAIFAGWQSEVSRKSFLPSARNLADYLALRALDIDALQASLAALGLSSVGRSEGHVTASLDALHASLCRIAGRGAPPYPASTRLTAGRNALERAGGRLFGSNPGGPGTRIMVTLPSVAGTDDGPLVGELVAAGMTCARINCAHDDAETWRSMVRHVRDAAASAGRKCRVLMDIGGPKCQIEQVDCPKNFRLRRGDRLTLVRTLPDARGEDTVSATISFPDILAKLAIDADVWINDGHIGVRVVERTPDRVVLKVFNARRKGERLKPQKGVNFPGTALDLGPLTDKDIADLDVVAEEADLVGFSFVQRVDDVRLLQHELARRRGRQPPMPLMLTIET